ncbi:MAG: amidohydrolase [Ignavibacteriaceae bacterium]|nr:amidohydrolase [Ignavibacteriaceae bacterium]
MKFILILLTGILLLNVSAANSPATSKKIYKNGKIFTADINNKWVEAVVTYGNKIIFAGSEKDAAKFTDKATEVIDLKGKLMLPGFIDNHTHFLSGGFYLDGLDLRGAKSTTEFKNIIREYAKNHPDGWITGGNWDHEAWEIKDLPRKEWIDEFTPNQPVMVDRFDGHMALANSYALKLAGITKDTPSPEGGLIVKDPVTGEPTGMLKDNAMGLVYSHIPDHSTAEYDRALELALAHAKRLGVTSVQDITYKNDLLAYQRFEKAGKLTCRVYTRLPVYEYKNLVNAGITHGFGSDLLKLGSLKVFADGSLGSSTAWFFEPYTQDSTTMGLPNDYVIDGRLKEWATDADKNLLQLSVHAIGDKANKYILDMFEEITRVNPKWDRRFRIEHAQHVRFDEIPQFQRLGVIASVQPYHAIDDGCWAEKRIGKRRIQYTYPFRSYLDGGVYLAFGSDWTVAPLSPILGIHAAVTRATLDGLNPDGWIPNQKISVEEAVLSYTITNAYAAFEEKVKGSIEPGKFADFVILEKDIFTIAPDSIKDVEVAFTIFDGTVIYKK